MPCHTRRRLGRGFAWAGAAVSLLLAGVWVGSMRWDVYYIFDQSNDIGVCDGGVQFTRDSLGLDLRRAIRLRQSGSWGFPARSWHVRWWYSYVDSRNVPDGDGVYTFIPLWPFVLLTGVPSAGYLYATRRRKGPGVCRACGYDLTGLRANIPCPECGGTAQG